MPNDDDDVKKLIQLAIPHDFGTTLRYIDDRCKELLKLLDKNSAIAKYVPRYNFSTRINRIRDINGSLDDQFDVFWDKESGHSNYFELEAAFGNEIAPLLIKIVENTESLDRMLARTRERFSGFPRDSVAAQNLKNAEELIRKIRYFSNRSKYYVRGMIDLYEFSPVTNPEITNMNRFIAQMNEFFHLSETREKIEILNQLPTLKIDYSHSYSLFSNFIRNSLKYKRSSKARMLIFYESADVVSRDELRGLPQYVPVGELKSGFIALHFVDEGLGIQRDKLQLIFQPFKRGIGPDVAAGLAAREQRHGKSLKDGFSYSDMGIGLAIAMRVAALYNGSIRASSTLGRGTCMSLIIPEHMVHT